MVGGIAAMFCVNLLWLTCALIVTPTTYHGNCNFAKKGLAHRKIILEKTHTS